MRNLPSKIGARSAPVLFFAALLLTTAGLSACSSKRAGDSAQWATMESASPNQAKGKGPTYSYDGTLTGTVKDEEGYPLEAVSVVAMIPGDPHIFATATDRNGKFELKFPKKLVKEIKYSILGKEPVTIPLGKKKKMDVILKDEALELDPGLLDHPTGPFRIVQPGE